MAWIESHQELAQHPKTARLARALNASVPAAIGHLHLFWWWAFSYASDGDITDFDPEEIAVAVMWPGEGEDFLKAMDKCRWTDVGEDGRRRIHDWAQYGGKLFAQRESDKERVRNWRANNRVTRNERVANGNVRVTNGVHTEHTEQREDTNTGRAILNGDYENVNDRSEDEALACRFASDSGYSDAEIELALAAVRKKKGPIKNVKSYLLSVLASNRTDANATPPASQFKPRYVNRNV